MRALLLVDYNPAERIVPYLIEDPTGEQIRVLEEVNNKYVGSDDWTDEMKCVANAISSNPEHWIQGSNEEFNGVWADSETSFPINQTIDLVILFGICA